MLQVARLAHLGVVGAHASGTAQERVGVEAAGLVEVDVELDLADLAALELRGQRLVLVLHEVGAIADELGIPADGKTTHSRIRALQDALVERYAAGNLRDVYFYREQLEGHIERTYHPGQ